MSDALKLNLACGGTRAGATRREFVALSIGAALGTAGLGRRAMARGLRQPAGRALEWREVRSGVWVASGEGGNTMLAASDRPSLLVDTKLAPIGITLRRQGEARASPLKMVINTHHHADHSGGNYAFREGPVIAAHEKAAGRISGQADRYIGQITSALSGRSLPDEVREDLEKVRANVDRLTERAWAPDVTIGDAAEWTLGTDLAVEVRHFGAGHTDNDIVVRLPGRNVLHAGDLLFHQMHPFFDPDGGGTCKGWIDSVRRTIELCDDSTVVIPGHGEVADVEGLRRQADYLEKLWEAVGALVDGGVSRAEAVQREWPFMQGLGRPQLRERAIGAVYDERTKR